MTPRLARQRPCRLAVNANKVLSDTTVGGVSLHASGSSASNCSAVGGAPVVAPTPRVATDDIAKACWAGGTIQIYINPNWLKNSTQPTSASFPTYEEVRNAVRNAFQSLSDPANPGKQVVLRIMNKEELRDVDGSDSLHPNRLGDVVVVLRPPYQSDAGTPGKAIALSHFLGQHGYLPDLVDLKNNINMHATFVAAGPGIRHRDNVRGLRAIDIAPTLAIPDGHPRTAERAGSDPVRHHRGRGAAARSHDPRYQRLPRPDHSAGRDVRHDRAKLRDRWVRLPEDVVRAVRG